MTGQLAMQELLMSGGANVQLSVSGNDLREFGQTLIRMAVEKFATKEERYLTVKEVAEVFGVDRSTLHRWNKTGYLKTVRIGGKPRYLKSDVDALPRK